MKIVFTKLPTCGRIHLVGNCPQCAAAIAANYLSIIKGQKELYCSQCKTNFLIKKIKDDQKVVATIENRAKGRKDIS